MANMHSSSDSARYEEAGMVKPVNSRTAGTGSVVDPREKYPSTHTFASSEHENRAKVEAGMRKRRPGGEKRKGHPFGCCCGEHPCKCGTETAKKHIIHADVNE